MSHAVRRVFLGDWNPIIRDPIDVLRGTFLAGGAILLLTGNLGAGVRLLLTFGLVVLCRVVNPPRPFDLFFVLGMALQGWGNVADLFAAYDWYNKVVHVMLSLPTAPLLYLALIRLGAVPDLSRLRGQAHPQWGVVIITFALGFSFGALYEIYEYLAVRSLGAGLAIGYRDTISDMGGNAAASLLGGVALVYWAWRGWGTTRRVPADALSGPQPTAAAS